MASTASPTLRALPISYPDITATFSARVPTQTSTFDLGLGFVLRCDFAFNSASLSNSRPPWSGLNNSLLAIALCFCFFLRIAFKIKAPAIVNEQSSSPPRSSSSKPPSREEIRDRGTRLSNEKHTFCQSEPRADTRSDSCDATTTFCSGKLSLHCIQESNCCSCGIGATVFWVHDLFVLQSPSDLSGHSRHTKTLCATLTCVHLCLQPSAVQKEGCEDFSEEVTLAQSSELNASGQQATNSGSLPPYKTPDQSNVFVKRPSASLERSVGTDVTPVYNRGSHAETIRNIAPRKTVCKPKQRKNSTASPQTVLKKQGGKVTRKGSTGVGRGATFTEPELNSLLEALETNLPVGSEEWEAVIGLHKAKFPNENRTPDSLRRKYASLYRRNAPTGDPRIPETVLRAKKIKRDMTERVDLGDDDDSGVEGVFSGDEERQHTEEIVPEDHEFPPTGEIDAVPIVGSDTPSSTIPLFPIVHKRPKRHVREEGDIMELFKASLLQDREFRIAEKERLQIEREEDRARSMVEAKLRKEQLEEERKARQKERDEARRQREEDRRNRESFMQMFMMFIAEGHTNANKDTESLLH